MAELTFSGVIKLNIHGYGEYFIDYMKEETGLKLMFTASDIFECSTKENSRSYFLNFNHNWRIQEDSKFRFHRALLYLKENVVPEMSHNYPGSTTQGSSDNSPKADSLWAHYKLVLLPLDFFKS